MVPSSARLAHAFVIEPGIVLALVDLRTEEDGDNPGGGSSADRGASGGRGDRYAIPFVVEDGVLREAVEGDGAWRALAHAIAAGQTVAALPHGGAPAPSSGGQVDAALVCRPSPGLAEAWAAPADPIDAAADAPGAEVNATDPPGGALGATAAEIAAAIAAADETRLGRDQSNTSVVLGGRLLLKGYRRIQPGLNPDLELTAYLSEEARFPGVPRLAGWAEVVTRDRGVATVAMLQAFVAHADDTYERTAELLAGLVAAPGSVSLEWATEVAADLGTLTAGLHAALASPPPDAPDLAPRPATRDELRAWRLDAHRQLNLALPAVAAVDRAAAEELRSNASAIAARASRFEAVASAPMVMRIHGDLHLGQILVAEDGYRVIDFEGEPLRSIEERRRLDSPLRDVASLLRSLDHVARSARRRAERRAGGPIERPGLDIEAWIERARARFIAAYVEGLRRAGAPFTVDLDLLDAFEVAKETYEFVYAATVLPSWLWAPREGMRRLLDHGEV